MIIYIFLEYLQHIREKFSKIIYMHDQTQSRHACEIIFPHHILRFLEQILHEEDHSRTIKK